jgi:hypothetical protein
LKPTTAKTIIELFTIEILKIATKMKFITATALLLFCQALTLMAAPVAEPISGSNEDLERVRFVIPISAENPLTNNHAEIPRHRRNSTGWL